MVFVRVFSGKNCHHASSMEMFASLFCIVWAEPGQWDAPVSGFDMAAHVQDFVLIKSLQDASGIIWCLSWSDHLLAAGSADKQVRIYDSNKELRVHGACWVCRIMPSTKTLRFQVPTNMDSCLHG